MLRLMVTASGTGPIAASTATYMAKSARPIMVGPEMVPRAERCLPERLTHATAVLPDGFDEEAALRVEDLGNSAARKRSSSPTVIRTGIRPLPPTRERYPRHKLLYAVIPGPRASERSQEPIT